MGTECYALVRGSSIRVTRLGNTGGLLDPIQYGVSKSVASVTINEVSEAESNESLGSEETDDDIRLRLVRPAQTIRYLADISFLRTDPGILSLIAGVPLVLDDSGDVVGFDFETRRPATAFALEVWSKLAASVCADGQRQWGYTLFPFLKGGYVSGVEFKNGLASFNLIGAQARRVPRWGAGPFDLTGTDERLLAPVSGNVLFKQFLTTAAPPTQVDGVQVTDDVIEGGTATMTTDDIVDGEFVDTSEWIVEGGRAV